MLISLLSHNSADCERVREIALQAAVQLQLEAELERECAHLWVCRTRARQPVLGFLLAWHVADEVHLIDIVTARRARRQGTGRALLKHLIGFAQEARARLIVLEVRRSNRPAILLYQALGFRVLRVRPGYYAEHRYAEHREDALEFVLTLAPKPSLGQPE